MQGFLKGVFFFIATPRLKTSREKSPVITVDLVYIKIYFWVYKTGHNKNPEGEGGLNGVQNNKKTKKETCYTLFYGKQLLKKSSLP